MKMQNAGYILSSMYALHNAVKIIQRNNCVNPAEESRYNKLCR